jgi:hypothetical protein
MKHHKSENSLSSVRSENKSDEGSEEEEDENADKAIINYNKVK